MDTLKARIEAKGLTIADLTTTEQRGVLHAQGHAWSGHFAIVETNFGGGMWITRRKIGSPKTNVWLPVANCVSHFVADAKASYQG